MINNQKSTTLVFGSPEANAILRNNQRLEAEAREAEPDEELPVKRWRVCVELTQDDYHYINARTAEEAMCICAREHNGDPYDAWEDLQHVKQTKGSTRYRGSLETETGQASNTARGEVEP